MLYHNKVLKRMNDLVIEKGEEKHGMGCYCICSRNDYLKFITC